MSQTAPFPASSPDFDASAPGYPVPSSRVELFRRLFIIKIAVMDTIDALYGQTVPLFAQGPLPILMAVLTPIACALALRGRTARAGLLLLAAVRGAGFLWTMPYTINHMLLELVLILAFALASGEPEGPPRRSALVFTARWAQVLFLSVWFYAGVQKLVHGYYLNGELFGLEAFADDRGLTLGLSGAVLLMMTTLAGWLGGTVPHVSAATLTDAVQLPLAPWMGPFLTALSTMIVVIEVGIPLLFLLPRARKAAVVALGLAQVGIALSSMEIDFALDNFMFLLLLWPAAAGFTEALGAPAGSASGSAVARRFRVGSLALLLVWPVVHMVLSTTLGFSSWRLCGWGMYATPDLWRLPNVYQVGPDGTLIPAPPPLEDSTLYAAYKPLHYFPGPDAAARYAEAYTEALGTDGSKSGADGSLILVLSRPRLDLGEALLYTESEVYRVADGQVEALGAFNTRDAGYLASVQALSGR